MPIGMKYLYKEYFSGLNNRATESRVLKTVTSSFWRPLIFSTNRCLANLPFVEDARSVRKRILTRFQL